MITGEQKQLIKDLVLEKYVIGCNLSDLAKQIEHCLIFGPAAANVHVNIDEIYTECLAVDAELNPPKVNDDINGIIV